MIQKQRTTEDTKDHKGPRRSTGERIVTGGTPMFPYLLGSAGTDLDATFMPLRPLTYLRTPA